MATPTSATRGSSKTDKVVTLNFGNAGSAIGSKMFESMLEMHGKPTSIEPVCQNYFSFFGLYRYSHIKSETLVSVFHRAMDFHIFLIWLMIKPCKRGVYLLI